MPPLTSDPSDLLRQYMLMSGINTPQKGMAMPFSAATPGGGEAAPGSAADLIKTMLRDPYAPGYLPGAGTIVPKDTGGGERAKPIPLTFSPLEKPAGIKVEEEEAFKTPQGWKDRKDDAITRARKALDEAGGVTTPDGAATAETVPPDKATAPTPEPHQFEGQYTVNPNAPKDQAEFYTMMRPHAEKIAAETGLDVNLVLSKIALETGFGKYAPGFNYFGIKETDPKKGQVLATKEEVDGKLVPRNERFRTYANIEESVTDYIQFLKTNGRYADLLKAKGLEAQLEALQKSGYATDSEYANKLRGIIKNIPQTKLPTATPTPTTNSPEPPAEPGRSVGEHRNGWFWNGASWDKAFARGGHIRDLLALSRGYRR